MALVKRQKKERKDPREAAWLALYFGDLSPERGNATQSAITARYDKDKAEAIGKRLEAALDKKPLIESLRAAGITKPKIALMIQSMRNQAESSADLKEVRNVIRLLLEVSGELSEDRQPSTNVFAPGAQILVVAGKTDERMKQLKAGASALPPKEETSATT